MNIKNDVLIGALLLSLSACGVGVLGEVLSSDDPVDGSPVVGIPAELDSEELHFVTLINQYRAENGLKNLKVSAELTKASKWMSTDMATRDYFNHRDSQGRASYTRIYDFGFMGTATGENIAAGNATAQKTFLQWKNSSGHNALMLSSKFLLLGISRAYSAQSKYGWYWTLDVGSP